MITLLVLNGTNKFHILPETRTQQKSIITLCGCVQVSQSTVSMAARRYRYKRDPATLANVCKDCVRVWTSNETDS